MYLPDLRQRLIYKHQSAANKAVMVQVVLLFPLCPEFAFCISKDETQHKTLPLAIIAIHLLSPQCIVAESESVLDTHLVI